MPLHVNDEFCGATDAEWEMMIKAGLTPYLLPCVQNQNLQISPRSKIKEIGKTPSVINRDYQIAGFRNWTKHTSTEQEIERWRRNNNYGICCRTGVGMLGFDCDCDDPQRAADIKALFVEMIGTAPLRFRGNAPRWLAPVKFDGFFKKRVIEFEGGDKLEILGTGQQFAAAGTHPSGERYQWSDDIAKMPAADIEKVEAFIAELIKRFNGKYSEDSSSKPRKKGKTVLLADPLADWLRDNGYVVAENEPGELQIICPWEEEHSMGEAGDTSTTYYQAGTNGHSEPAFKCLHGHCAERNIGDLISWAVSKGYERTNPLEFPVIEGADEPDAEKRDDLFEKNRKYYNEKTQKFDACLPAVVNALAAGEWYTGYEIRYDSFCGSVVAKIDGEWAPLTDAIPVKMRILLQDKKGFKPISKDVMRDAIIAVADDNTFDSMVEFLDRTIPAWDGADRVSSFFKTYCNGDDRPYEQAVARYLFSALWGRGHTPEGIKADIVPILLGPQGALKSTLVKTLAIEDRFFGEISFKTEDADLIRIIRGKLTVEAPELSGMRKRESEDMKRLITTESDEHVKKYEEYSRKTPRRCTFFMTTNEDEFLTDITGNRRYAPVRVGKIDIKAVKRDLLQLWAQGRELFRMRGIDHRAVEALSEKENEKYMKSDPWTESVQEWLLSEPKDMDGKPTPLTAANILLGALGLPAARVGVVEARRLGTVMRELGYTRKNFRVNRSVIKIYVRNEQKDDVPF